jgi:hypothetical protein
MKNMLRLCVLSLLFSTLAHAVGTPLAEYASDYLCMLQDPRGVHNNDGLAITLTGESPDVRFVRVPDVLYPFSCKSQNEGEKVIIDCSFAAVPDYQQHIEIYPKSLQAKLTVVQAGLSKEWDMKCTANN